MATNDTLITTADIVTLTANDSADVIGNTDGATAFVVDTGNVGDDSIANFGKNDSLLTKKKIYDGNGDGIIDFGSNGVLDVDRTSSKFAGADQLQLLGMESKALRYLGEKQGYFVYADASVRLAGFTEGTVNNDTFNAVGGSKTFFYDNALGLNLGKDTINNFSVDDLIVTTSKVYDSQDNGIITFGGNKILDLSGEGGPAATDPTHNPGGQIDVNGLGGDIQQLHYLGSTNVSGVDYFYYGLEGATIPGDA